jgi:hypothetical protein
MVCVSAENHCDGDPRIQFDGVSCPHAPAASMFL